jgi:hypothetical protein
MCLAGNIEDLSREKSFSDFGVAAACRVCSRVPIMNTETATSILNMFFLRYQEESLVLISSINCDSIGAAAHSVIEPFLYPLLKEVSRTTRCEEGGMAAPYKGMLEIEKKKNSVDSSEIASLKVIGVFEGNAAAATKKCQLIGDDNARKASQEAKDAFAEMHTRLNTGISDASSTREHESVVIILSLEQIIITSKVNISGSRLYIFQKNLLEVKF